MLAHLGPVGRGARVARGSEHLFRADQFTLRGVEPEVQGRRAGRLRLDHNIRLEIDRWRSRRNVGGGRGGRVGDDEQGAGDHDRENERDQCQAGDGVQEGART